MFDRSAKHIKSALLKLAPHVFGNHPVLFSYLYGSYATGLIHTFSDVDIGIYVEKVPAGQFLELELSLALTIDARMDNGLSSDVRVINNLPLTLLGTIITEGALLFSRNEGMRVEFETLVRKRYFDFAPVMQRYHVAYRERTVSGVHSRRE